MSASSARAALIVMAKWPEPGQVKTRLCPPLDPEEAAGLYRAMLLDVLAASRHVSGVQLVVGFFPGEKEAAFRELLGEGALLVCQEGPDLARRMGHCFAQVFQKGYAPVLMRNSDGPTMPGEVVSEALAELAAGAGAVFSPDASSGFGLMGLARPVPKLLEAPLASERSYEEILARCEAAGLPAEAVTGWYDVDGPRDLSRLLAEHETGAVPRHTAAFLSGEGRAARWRARLLTG